LGRGRFGEISVTRPSSTSTRRQPKPQPTQPQPRPVSFNPRPQPTQPQPRPVSFNPRIQPTAQPQQRTKKPTSVFQPTSQPVRTSTRSSRPRPRQTIQAVQRQAPEKLPRVGQSNNAVRLQQAQEFNRSQIKGTGTPEFNRQTKQLGKPTDPNRSSSSLSFRKGGVIKNTIVAERTNLFGNREGFTRQINYKKDDTGFKKLSGNTDLTTPNPKAKFQSQEKRDFAEITRLNAGKTQVQQNQNPFGENIKQSLNELGGNATKAIREPTPRNIGNFMIGKPATDFVSKQQKTTGAKIDSIFGTDFKNSGNNVSDGFGKIKRGLLDIGDGVSNVASEVSPPFIIGNAIKDNVKVVPNNNDIFGLGIQFNNPFGETRLARKPTANESTFNTPRPTPQTFSQLNTRRTSKTRKATVKKKTKGKSRR